MITIRAPVGGRSRPNVETNVVSIMYMLAVVRDVDDLSTDLPMICDLVSRVAGTEGRLIGVWCDPDAVADPLKTIAVPCDRGSLRPLLLQQTFELSGVWALWCFEPAFDGDWSMPPPAQEATARALAGSGDPVGRRLYIPVFDTDRPAAETAAALKRLVRLCPRRIGAPLYHDRRRGRLSWDLAWGARTGSV